MVKKLFLSINFVFIILGSSVLIISSGSSYRELELNIIGQADFLVENFPRISSSSKVELLNDLKDTVQEISKLLMLAGIGFRGFLSFSVVIIAMNTFVIIKMSRLIKEKL
jgi:hypothetical protein